MSKELWTKRLATPIVVAALWLFWTTPVFAHSVDKRFGDFYGGLLHPITALVHLFPIVGLSLLSAQQGRRSARWTVFLFPAAVLGGAILATNAGPNEFVAWGNRSSFVILGVLVAAAVRVPLPILAVISLFFGFTHGYENTAEISQTVAMRMFLPGIVVAAFSVVSIVAAIVVTLEQPWQQIAVRVAGSWIAAIGLLVIGLG